MIDRFEILNCHRLDQRQDEFAGHHNGGLRLSDFDPPTAGKGYSATSQTGKFDGLELCTFNWQVTLEKVSESDVMIRSKLLLFVLFFGALIEFSAAAEISIDKNVMVPMRDGVRLATDVYIPAESATDKLPVILIRTPYNKNGKESNGMFFAEHGYVFVAQDVRGRYKSEGDFYIYTNEGPDGYDTVEWIAEQPWCNGDVGTWGSSYQAATQNALAVLRPPHLRTMFVVNGTSNYVEDGAGRGGAFALLHNMAYCFRLASTGKEATDDSKVKAALDSAYDQLSQWPPTGFKEQNFYLHADGSLRTERPQSSDPSAFQFDPKNPVPTIGGNIDSGKHLVPRGAYDQTPEADHPFSDNELPLSSRQDVLTFETPPLEQDVEVTGPMQVSLWVSSVAKDTDFTAKLDDVYPPSDDYPSGYAMNIEDGILRMRFRNGRERGGLMQPGKVYQVNIDLWTTANVFRKGHRIRLDISSSNFPMFDVNPNTGEPLGRHTRMKKTLNTVYHDAEHPSSVVLPVRAEQ